MTPIFKAGRNIAMKVPVHEYLSTVSFYRDILGLREITSPPVRTGESSRFEFGDKILWLDRTPCISQAEIWLEIITDDINLAEVYLQQHGCILCNEIEPLPEGMKAFWLSSPANIIHLITES